MRYKKILISGILLTRIMEKGYTFHAKCVEGIPKDSKFCYSIPDTINGIWIVIEHESFPELADGDIIPIFDKPMFEAL